MKKKPPFALNHMQLVFTNSRHNLLHYLLVVFIRMTHFAFSVPLAVYLFGLGTFFSIGTIKIYLAPERIKVIETYLEQLPFLSELKNYLFTQIQKSPFWWTLVIAFPLIIFSLLVFFNNLANLLFSLISFDYNSTHCPLCQEAISLTKKNQSEVKGWPAKTSSDG